MRDDNEAQAIDGAFGHCSGPRRRLGWRLVDRDLRFRRVNERLATVTGMAPGAHIGQSLVDVLGGLGAELNTLCRRVLDDQQPITDAELAASGPGRLTVRLTTGSSPSPRSSSRGRVAGVSLVVQDITARKRAETRAHVPRPRR